MDTMKKDIDSLTKEWVREFIKKGYHPKGAIVMSRLSWFCMCAKMNGFSLYENNGPMTQFINQILIGKPKFYEKYLSPESLIKKQ